MSNTSWTVQDIPNQKGQVIIITGATSGLGKEASKVLANKNATVIMAVRNTNKAEKVANEIRADFPNAQLDIRHLDLGSLDSIKSFVTDFSKDYKQLDVLINNAGVMACPYSKTADNFEIQMGTNHFGPFALTGLLMPMLKKSTGARIVSTSSIAHRQGNIDFSDINWENRTYKTNKAYSDSKIANLYFTYELSRKLAGKENAPKITAAHPGWTKTDLQKHSLLFRMLNPIFSQGVQDGVLPTLRAAFDPNAQSGDYFGPNKMMEMRGIPVKVSSNNLSQDQMIAEHLWEVSEELTGVNY